MPARISKDVYLKLVHDASKVDSKEDGKNDKIQELRYKQIMTGSQKGHIKLKLRTNSTLFTYVVPNPSDAKKLIKKAENAKIKTRNLNKKTKLSDN